MKIAFDVHGTIASDKIFFKTLMNTLMLSGIEVCIISGPPINDIIFELNKLGFVEGEHYSSNNSIHSVVGYLKNHTNVEMTQDENLDWWCDDTVWWQIKGSICKHYNIDMIYDNDIRYKKSMPDTTTFIHWRG